MASQPTCRGTCFCRAVEIEATGAPAVGEKVIAMRDGLPKYKDFPKKFGGSGDVLPDQVWRRRVA
jgi:hypothetical protein